MSDPNCLDDLILNFDALAFVFLCAGDPCWELFAGLSLLLRVAKRW
jgi:hypothetical protein